MAYSRYSNRNVFLNSNSKYQSAFFENRAVKSIEQYESPEINYPSQEEIDSLTNISEIWDSSSKLYNLAYDHYGDASYWWVIAWYNRKPTEAHFEVGDTVYIPMPLSRAMELF
jgi:hypothetical protein